MRRALIYSLVLHFAVIAIGYVGGFFWRVDPPSVETAMMVEVVTVADKSNVPVQKKQAAGDASQSNKRSSSASDGSSTLKQASPKPKISPPTPQPPKPPVAEVTPGVEPVPDDKVRDPISKPSPADPVPEGNLEAVKPKRKPESKPVPPSSFASVLKTVEELKRQPQLTDKKKESKDSESEEAFDQKVSDALSPSRSANYDSSQPVTMSEIDLVRRQIEKCWNLPAGAQGAENLVVSVRVEMNIDGTPSVAAVVERERMRGDPFFRAAAESALRAVLNPRCHPFRLPREKYDSWKAMTLVFDPKEMFGT